MGFREVLDSDQWINPLVNYNGTAFILGGVEKLEVGLSQRE